MAAHQLSPKLGREALDVLALCKGNIVHAAEKLKIPRTTLQSRIRSARLMGLHEPLDAPVEAPGPLTFDEQWAQWRQTIGMAKDRYKARQKRPAFSDKRILVIPDLHVPFHEPEMVADMLAKEGEADLAVCIGDLSDSYSLSTYVSYNPIPYEAEWAACTAMVQTLSETFPETVILSGNHDTRLEKRVRERLSEAQVKAVLCITGGTLCPVTAISRRYSNITMASHVTPSGETISWCQGIGDAWFGHAEVYSRVPGTALRNTHEWLVDNEESLGFQDYRCIVMGHTHQAGLFPWRANKLLVECGCLCKQQGYMRAPSSVGKGRPQRRGYVTLNQKDGRTDLNSVRFHWFDAEDR